MYLHQASNDCHVLIVLRPPITTYCLLIRITLSFESRILIKALKGKFIPLSNNDCVSFPYLYHCRDVCLTDIAKPAWVKPLANSVIVIPRFARVQLARSSTCAKFDLRERCFDTKTPGCASSCIRLARMLLTIENVNYCDGH